MKPQMILTTVHNMIEEADDLRKYPDDPQLGIRPPRPGFSLWGMMKAQDPCEVVMFWTGDDTEGNEEE